MSIDWSKAPEGFDYQLTGKSLAGTSKFYMKVDSVQRYVSASGSFVQFVDAGEFHIEQRPEPAQAWSGAGLPPVGAVCQFVESRSACAAHDGINQGTEVKVVAHFEACEGVMVAAFTFKDGDAGIQVSQAIAKCFRPIRTPEQIAAEEREKSADSLYLTMWPNDTLHECEAGNPKWNACLKAVDAGYRKQVAP